ncbi:MAG: hypothetical protein HY043_05955 [Verrucomicrobia bacterium]|nr:hypothetical protein [Verrucomicrobiota bacterium]
MHRCRFLWLAALSMAWLLTDCSREQTVPAPTSTNAAALISATNEVAVDSFLPYVGEVTGYVGAKQCQECHADQHASWQKTFHRTMTQLPRPGTVLADFNHVVLTNAAVRYTLIQRSNEFWVHLESIGPGPPGNPAPEPEDVPLGLVTGSHHMQVFWLPNGLGSCQMGFPFTWLIPEKRWVPRNSTFIRPPALAHQPETWNHVCSRCHATGTQPNYSRETKTWLTQVADFGIACEACHGPGEHHATQQRDWKRRGKKAEPRGENLFIVHPEKIPPARASQICGFCHSMKWWDRAEGWPERGFSYRPGDDLEASTPIIRPKEVENQPWLKNVLTKNPEIFRDFFWDDGMIRVSGREYNGLIESPCYHGGKFSCLSCHSLHDSEPDDMLARNRTDNRACTQCHEQFRAESQLTAHTHHAAGSSGSECYNCHMPHTTYGVLTAIRAHQISSPRVADELATGRPNACNLCHLDQTLAWTAEKLSQWYRQPASKLSDDQTAVANSVRLALTGDAGQRALLAWHFGWEPAAQISGKSWSPVILAQLLDDPYAAVRCVAERSLKQIADVIPPGYDYTIAPETRASARSTVVENWRKKTLAMPNLKLPDRALVTLGDSAETQATLQRLVRQRNERPVRLRE